MSTGEDLTKAATNLPGLVPRPAPPLEPDPVLAVGAAPDEPTLRMVHEAVSAVQRDLRARDDRLEAAQRIIEKLHDENDRLRAGVRQLALHPIQIDLQRMRNDLLRQAETLPPDVTPAKAADMLASFAVTVELVLERCGVVVIRPEPGTAFDATNHRAVGTSAAPSPDLDATVAERVTDGYLDSVTQRVMSPASVRVYQWSAPHLPADPPT